MNTQGAVHCFTQGFFLGSSKSSSLSDPEIVALGSAVVQNVRGRCHTELCCGDCEGNRHCLHDGGLALYKQGSGAVAYGHNAVIASEQSTSSTQLMLATTGRNACATEVTNPSWDGYSEIVPTCCTVDPPLRQLRHSDIMQRATLQAADASMMPCKHGRCTSFIHRLWGKEHHSPLAPAHWCMAACRR